MLPSAVENESQVHVRADADVPVTPDILGKITDEPGKKSRKERNGYSSITACDAVRDEPISEKSETDQKVNSFIPNTKDWYAKVSSDDSRSQVISPEDSMLEHEKVMGA
eukprot:gnl/MRDRNA2_/MRDRNA2_227981_c0_seq1.p1 gnl/MRDRNA2_/MRDRNA2_227981_c0~~gnl/MRDRNA2_/MRDRNA2_227981_c0_seq1.p1  ORF type:complete len:120 (-),score=16.80 gnl/MRDRNA2_/MRDRNA2_227981_c0_seq1:156-482(-)